MKYSISEVLHGCDQLVSETDQVTYLQHYGCDALKAVLKYALDPNVEWLLPIGTPPYTPTTNLDQHGNLYREARKLNLFVKGGMHPTMQQLRRETLFVQFIEGLDPKDASLMCSIKDKILPYKRITPTLVNSAFPGLVSI